MKKGFVKTLVALVAGVMLLSMNMSAFALEYGASTKYKDASTATVTVNYTAGATEQVAFLAEQSTNIIYIDQKEGTGSPATFSFDIPLTSAISEFTLKAGSTNEAYTDAKKQTLSLASKTLTVTSGENGYVAVDANTTYEETIKLYVMPATGFEVNTVTVDETVQENLTLQDGKFYSINLNGLGETVAIHVTFKAATITNDAVATFTSLTDNSDESKRSITVFGTATNASAAGILLSTGELTKTTKIPTSYKATAEVRAFPALALNANHEFSVTLEENVADAVHLTAGTYNVGVYAANANGHDVAVGTSAVTFSN